MHGAGTRFMARDHMVLHISTWDLQGAFSADRRCAYLIPESGESLSSILISDICKRHQLLTSWTWEGGGWCTRLRIHLAFMASDSGLTSIKLYFIKLIVHLVSIHVKDRKEDSGRRYSIHSHMNS